MEVEPPEAPRKVPWDKILAVVVVILVAVAAWGWLRPVGPAPEEEIPNTAPTAVGSVDRTVGDIGDAFSLDGSGSSDPDTGDSIASWEWDLGDGTIIREVKAKGGDGRIQYVYSVSGDYVVGLTVTDTRGATANNDVSLITVKTLHPPVPAANGTAPFAILSSDVTVIQPNTTVSFDADSSWVWVWSDGDFVTDIDLKEDEQRPAEGLTSFRWFFGDGQTGTGNVTTHKFVQPGNYPVKLVVSTADGRRDVVIKTIRALEPGSPFQGVIKNPDSYVRAVIGEPEHLDPAKAYDTASGFVVTHVTEPLIWYNKGSVTELVPWLATNVPSVAAGTIFNDNKSYKFLIRPNVKFHTGTTLTAEDVEYSIERMLVRDPSGGPMWMLKEILFGVENTSGVFLPYSVIDAAVVRNDAEQSVTFHLKEPRADFLQVMAFWVGNIMPKAYAIANGDWNGTSLHAEAIFEEGYDFWNDHLVGTGPYKFVRWDRRQQVIMERFDDYWGGNFPGEAKRPAKLKTIVSKLVEEFSTRKLLLLSGDVDHADIPIQFEDQFTGKPELKIYRGLKNLVASPFLTFNQRINKTYAPAAWVGTLLSVYPEAVAGDWLTWFADRDLRLALSYAFDAQSYITEIYRGNAQQLTSPIPEGLLGYNKTSPAPRTLDLTKAEEHFRAAWNQTGSSVWTRGFEVACLFNSGNTAREGLCSQLKTNVESLNAKRSGLPPFKINVRGESWGSVYIPGLINHGLTLFTLGWIADYADPHNFVQPFLHSTGTFAFFMGFDNSTLDGKIEQAVLTTVAATRISLYQEISQSAFNDAVYASIIQAHGFRVDRTWLKNWYHNPMGIDAYVWALDKF